MYKVAERAIRAQGEERGRQTSQLSCIAEGTYCCVLGILVPCLRR